MENQQILNAISTLTVTLTVVKLDSEEGKEILKKIMALVESL